MLLVYFVDNMRKKSWRKDMIKISPRTCPRINQYNLTLLNKMVMSAKREFDGKKVFDKYELEERKNTCYDESSRAETQGTSIVVRTEGAPVQEIAHSEKILSVQLAKQEDASTTHQKSLVILQTNSIEIANAMSTNEPIAAGAPVSQPSELRLIKETESSQPKRKTDDVNGIDNLDPKRRRTSISAEQEDPESIIAESKRLWASIEPISNRLKSEKEAGHDVKDKPRANNFDTRKPVSLSKLMQDRSSRYMNYVRVDLQTFKDIITEYPLDKERIVSEIDGITKVWADWFRPPPLEIKRLLDGFSALREALTLDPQSLIADLIAKQDQARDKAAATKSCQDTVAATCASMAKATKVFEDQLSSQELQLQQYLSHAQELRIQIQELNAKLRQVEDAHDQVRKLKEHTTHCLSSHADRLVEANSLKSELEQLYSQDQVQLQNLEEKIASFFKQDEMGTSEHVRSLFDFFISSFKA